MAGYPKRRTLIDRIVQMERDIAYLHRRVGQSESRTFIVGEFDTSTFIPPLRVSIDPDTENPEARSIHGFRGTVRTGSCTLQWLLNDVAIWSDHAVDTTSGHYDVGPPDFTPIVLEDGDRIRVVVTDVFDVPDGLEATVVFTMTPR